MAKADLTITASGGSNDAAHLGNGIYSLELTATDTDTDGPLFLSCVHATPATFVPVWHEFEVIAQAAWDADHGDATAVATLIGTPSDLFSGATLADNLVDIEAQTNDIGTAGAGLTESGGTGDQFTAIDIASIAGNAAAAIGLSYSGRAIVAGTAFCDADPCVAVAGTLSATQMSTNLTETTDTHFVDRIIIWITGDLAGAVGTIEAYNGTTKVLTYTSQGEAPSAGDVFVIL
jgi:hypothetical protein